MKKYIIVIMLMAIGMASCSKIVPETENENNDPTIKELSDGSRLITIYADCDKILEDGIEGKTSYASDKTFSWVAGDKISVLFHNSSDEPVWVDFTAVSTAASSRFTATVDGDLTMGAPTTGTYWALYPANANHV